VIQPLLHTNCKTNILAIQNWFKKWRKKSNISKPVHVTFIIRSETCPLVHINVHLYAEDIKYRGLHLDRRLAYHKHIFAKRKQVGPPSAKCTGYAKASQNIPQAVTSHTWNNTQTNLDLRNATLGYGFHFQHINSRTFPIERFEHDSGRTLVYTKYGYPKRSPNTTSFFFFFQFQSVIRIYIL
jgi:hypothetical protein